MATMNGAGCWPGRAEGTVVWIGGRRPPVPPDTSDRSGEILRLRAEVARAILDLEAWAEAQPTVAGRLQLQACREALQQEAWARRTCQLIDTTGCSAAAAAAKVAEQVSAVLDRNPALAQQAQGLRLAAEWLAERLAPPMPEPPYPPDAVMAAPELNPLLLLDLRHAAILSGPQPPVTGGVPLVWGVPGLGPSWAGRRIAIDGTRLDVSLTDPRWWQLKEHRLRGLPVCQLNGDLAAIGRTAARFGQPPAVVVGRLDDLAAVLLFTAQCSALAVDLDRIGSASHPGVVHLLTLAAAATRRAGIPLLAGGRAALADPARWFALGFAGLFGSAHTWGGPVTNAL